MVAFFCLIPPLNENLKIIKNNHFPSGDLRPFACLHLAVAEHHACCDDLLGLAARIHHIAGLE